MKLVAGAGNGIVNDHVVMSLQRESCVSTCSFGNGSVNLKVTNITASSPSLDCDARSGVQCACDGADADVGRSVV